MSTAQIREDLRLVKAEAVAAVADPATRHAFGELLALLEGLTDAVDEAGAELDDAIVGIEPERAAALLEAIGKGRLVAEALQALVTGSLAPHIPEEERGRVVLLTTDTIASLDAAAQSIGEITFEDVEDEGDDE